MKVKDVSLVPPHYEKLSAAQKSRVPADAYLLAVSLLSYKANGVMNPEVSADPPPRAGPGTKTNLAPIGTRPPPKKLREPQPAAAEVTPGLTPVDSPEKVDLPPAPPVETRYRILGRKHTGLSQGNTDLEKIGTLRRPWRKNTLPLARGVDHPETVLSLSRRNYKVYADLGISTSILVRQLTILDTGQAPISYLSTRSRPGWEALVIPGAIPTIADANGRTLRTSGQIPLVVRLGDRTMRCTFIVCQRLAAPVILGCEFNDKFVEAIYPRRKLVELDDGTKVPIVCKPVARDANDPPLPSEQEYAPEAGRISSKLKVSRAEEILAGTQTRVYVTSGRTGLSVLEANPQLYAKHQISLSNG